MTPASQNIGYAGGMIKYKNGNSDMKDPQLYYKYCYLTFLINYQFLVHLL